MDENKIEMDLTQEELIKIYGEIPADILEAPKTHSIEDAISGTVEEDKEVIFNEISE